MFFLPFDKAVAPKVGSVIIPGSDGWGDGQKRFWNRFNNTKTESDTAHVSNVNGEPTGTHGWVIEWAYARPHILLTRQTRGRKVLLFKMHPNS